MKKPFTVPTYYIITQESFDSLKTRDLVKIKCQYCENIFETKKKNILRSHCDGRTVKTCSAKCSNSLRMTGRRVDVNCKNCNKSFSKVLSQFKKSENHFCSKSCSASYINTINPKRKTKKLCKDCCEPLTSYLDSYCKKHKEQRLKDKYKNKTIGEYRLKKSVQGKHPSWISSHIRQFARSWNKPLISKPCAFCGYDKHVELAHIKGVSTFDDNAKLSLVNSETNIIQLCPNCHWEFDNSDRINFKEKIESLGKIYSEK